MNSSCPNYREELSALADGQVDANAKAEVQAHLQGCESCSRELAKIKSLSRFLAQGVAQQNMPEPDIWERMKGNLPSLCDVMLDDLSAYLDGELSASAQEGVNRHLKECVNCLDAFKALNATNRIVAKSLELPPSMKVDIWPSIKARLNEDCALIHSELSAYADQEVVTMRHRTITAHLIECEGCRNEFNHLSAVGEIIRESYQPQMPDNFDLWPDIRRKLQVVPFASKAAAKSKTLHFSRRAYLSATAAAAVAIIGSLSFWFSGPRAIGIEPVSSEAYLIESTFQQPAEIADAAVLEEH
jgi:anti-sigma factor RsiW